MTTSQNKTPKMGGGTAFRFAALKSAISMACTMALGALAFQAPLLAQGERPNQPQQVPMPAMTKTLQDYYPTKSSTAKIQNTVCEPLQEIPIINGCDEGPGIGIYGGPSDIEAAGVEVYNEGATSERGGAVSIYSNAVTDENRAEGGYINFLTKWQKGSTTIEKGWVQHMIIRPHWEDASKKGNVGIGQDWPSDRLVVDGTIRGTNFRLEPNGDWSWGGFGGPGYGLGRGEIYPNAPNFSGQQLSVGTRPVLLQGLNGVGIATQNARFALNANGTSCIGLTEQEVLPIANLTGNAANEYKLYVKKGIRAERVKVDLQSTWADYVFAKDYQLPSLTEVQQHIDTKGHLPGVPSACEVESEGIDLAEMAKLQMQKIEELTLYILQQEARIKALEAKAETKE